MKPELGPATRQRVGPSGRAALQLLACCPRIPTDVVGVVLGMRHTRSAAQLLLGLCTAGLAHYEAARPGPLVGSRAVRLWTLTPAGQAIISTPGLTPPLEPRTRLMGGKPARWPDGARQRDLPTLVVAYRLLARVIRELNRPVRIAAWEHPWIRTYVHAGTGRARHVRLLAAVTLVQQDTDGEPVQRLLLLPDVGTIPVASYQPVLRGLTELTCTSDSDEQRSEPLLVVGVAAGADSGARSAQWHALLQRVARRAGEPSLPARVFAWTEGPGSSVDTHHQSASQAEQVFGLVARHPLLTRPQLATLLGTSEMRIARLVVELTAHGWVRTFEPTEVGSSRPGFSPHQLRRLALIELTPAGRREAARRLLLPTAVAARHHGLLGKITSTGRFFRHLAHTLGANAVFVAFVSAARRVTSRGGADVLEEWRSAAACARGRFRPDGYGCYRRDGSRFGFFLEFDRGTERPYEHAAKLAAYSRYRDSGAYGRDYESFPTLLIVATSEGAEARFAHQVHLLQQRYGGTPSLTFLTTTARIQDHPDSVVGPIWRGPEPGPWLDHPARGYWLPGHPGRSAAAVGEQRRSG